MKISAPCRSRATTFLRRPSRTKHHRPIPTREFRPRRSQVPIVESSEDRRLRHSISQNHHHLPMRKRRKLCQRGIVVSRSETPAKPLPLSIPRVVRNQTVNSLRNKSKPTMERNEHTMMITLHTWPRRRSS